jgi:hypothetical protein
LTSYAAQHYHTLSYTKDWAQFCCAKIFRQQRGKYCNRPSIPNAEKDKTGTKNHVPTVAIFVTLCEVLKCIIHTQILTILQLLKLDIACLLQKFGGPENLLDVLTQHKTSEFCKKGLNRLKVYQNNLCTIIMGFQSLRGRAGQNQNQEPDWWAVRLFKATRHEIKGKRLS